MASQPIRVPFVSNRNSAGEPTAEALLRRYGGADFAVESAGAQPRPIDPLAIATLAEVGIDASAARSRSYGDVAGRRFDHVITLSDHDRETCPAFEGTYTSLHWGFPDPAEVVGDETTRLDAFRRTRIELSTRLRTFIEVSLRTAGWASRPALA